MFLCEFEGLLRHILQSAWQDPDIASTSLSIGGTVYFLRNVGIDDSNRIVVDRETQASTRPSAAQPGLSPPCRRLRRELRCVHTCASFHHTHHPPAHSMGLVGKHCRQDRPYSLLLPHCHLGCSETSGEPPFRVLSTNAAPGTEVITMTRSA